MENLTKLYTKSIHEQLEFYYAQWLPTEKMEIGVVGTLEGDFWGNSYLFRPLTTLNDLGISFSSETDIKPDDDSSQLKIASTSGVEFISKIAGEVSTGLPNIPEGKAGLGYEFAEEGAYVLNANEVYEPRIRNVAALEPKIMEAYEKGRWKLNYAAVYSVVQAEYADMLVSQSSTSKIELEAKGDATIGQVELGNANIQFAVKRESGAIVNMLGSKNVTPLFKLIGIKTSWAFIDEVGLLKIQMSSVARKKSSEKPNASHLYLDILRYAPSQAPSLHVF